MPQPSGTSMTDKQRFEAQAEAAYDKMYDATNVTEAAARYNDAKEALSDAKAVFRSQFG